MGIRLDWDVESDLGHASIGEDAEAIAQTQRRRKRSLLTVIAAAVILLIAAAIAGYRYKIVHDYKLQMLHATIEAEALALRLGDEDKFMRLQGPSPGWRALQRDNFDEIQALGFNVEVTGRVLHQTVTDDEAEVTVEIVVNGEPLEIVWLYQYLDNRWVHTDTRDEPWVKQTVERGPFTFRYYTPEQPTVDQLEALLVEWWTMVAQDTGTQIPLEIAIVLDPEATRVKWTNHEFTEVAIPSNAARQADLASPDDPLRLELAAMMGDRWADALMVEGSRDLYDLWARDQLELWLERRFGVTDNRPSVFLYLTQAYGSDVLPRFITRWHGEGNGYQVMREVIVANRMPSNPTNRDFESFLSLIAALNDSSDQILFALEQDGSPFFEVSDEIGAHRFGFSQWMYESQPGSFRVEKTEQLGDVLWLTVYFLQNQSWFYPTDRSNVVPASALIPFRKVDSRWKVALLRPDDWGEMIVAQGERITFTYYEIDAATYDNLMPSLENAYALAAEDFNLTDLPPLHVEILNDPANWQPMDDQVTGHIAVYPHRLYCCLLDVDWEAYVEYTLVTDVYGQAFIQVAGEQPENFQAYTVQSALLRWGFARHGWEVDFPPPTRRAVAGVPVHDSWDDLWNASGIISDEAAQYRYSLAVIGAQTLIDMIMETYGEDAYLPLTQNLYAATSAQEWLQVSLKLDADDLQRLEDQWRERFHEAVRQQYGDEAFDQDQE